MLFATTPQLSFEDGCPVQTQTEDAMELEEDGEIIETLLVALQDEVDQLSTVLEKTSNAVSGVLLVGTAQDQCGDW